MRPSWNYALLYAQLDLTGRPGRRCVGTNEDPLPGLDKAAGAIWVPQGKGGFGSNGSRGIRAQVGGGGIRDLRQTGLWNV